MADLLLRIEQMDRRWVFVIMFIAISVPLFIPIQLPIRVSAEVQGYYDLIESLQPGDVVYLAADYDPGSQAELKPMLVSSLDHLFRKDIKVVGATLWPAGPPLLASALQQVGDEYGKVSGVDYVNLGFKEGRESVMVQLGKSFRGVYPTDFNRTPVEELPLLAEKKPDGSWVIDTFEDVKVIVNVSAGYPGTKEWVQQVRSRYNIPIVSGCTAVSAPEYYPYVQSGQLSGLLGGLSGAAEYEKLTGRIGVATTGMAGQSLGHVTIVVLILIGNILYFVNKRRRVAGSES